MADTKKRNIDPKQLQQSVIIPLAQLEPNKGQIEGVPENPRSIDVTKFKKLKASIEENPEMLSLREVLVYPHGDKYVIIGGNMRYRALKELGYKDAVCKVIPQGTTAEQLRAVAIKDNNNFGDWDFDALANLWNAEELDRWGIDLPPMDGEVKEDEAKEDNFNPDSVTGKAKSKEGDIFRLGRHRLICGDSTDAQVLQILMADQKADLLLTDPPYNVDYSSKNEALNAADKGNRVQRDIANDSMDAQAFKDFLCKAFANANAHLKPGGAFYIWHADTEGLNFRLAVREAGWELKQVLVWVKNNFVLGRQDYQWKHEPCQPAGTRVMTTKGEKNIEDLTEQDRVISWDKLSGQVKGYRNGGYAIKTANRDYNGKLYTIRTAGKKTRVTDNHQFSVRFNNKLKRNYCTYLMKRGNWWRVGQTKAYDSRQFGLKTRLHQEKADAVWLIGVYTDRIEAQVAEQTLTCKYGIPYTIWEQDRFNHSERLRSQQQIADIYAALDLQQMETNAHRLLHDFNRSERFPLITRETAWERFSTRVTAQIAACNLVPELMQVPMPTGDSVKAPNFTWQEITEVTAKPFKGRVYSLAVEKYQHYIADGIITHNCLYGWKPGASHYFIARRDLVNITEDEALDLNAMTKQELKDLLTKIMELPTTVIYENKPMRSADYPTMKPLKLMGRLIKNSTRPGEVVLDLFGGSGSTMMAAEQLGRSCYMVELDPVYIDVICKRYEELTGEKAEYLGNFKDASEK